MGGTSDTRYRTGRLIGVSHPWDCHSALPQPSQTRQNLPICKAKRFPSPILATLSISCRLLLSALLHKLLNSLHARLTLFATFLSRNSTHPSLKFLPVLPLSFLRRFLTLGSASAHISEDCFPCCCPGNNERCKQLEVANLPGHTFWCKVQPTECSILAEHMAQFLRFLRFEEIREVCQALPYSPTKQQNQLAKEFAEAV